jgi:hypothetical protein
MSKYLVFSHSFGVKKDSRGMFTDIAEAFPEYSSILFDYNKLDRVSNVLTVGSLRDQAKILQAKVHTIHQTDPDADVTLICHSQGCVVAALAKIEKINQAILLAPPGSVSSVRVNEHFGKREGVVIEKDGTIRVPRKDGSTTRLTKEYIDDLSGIDAIQLYKELSQSTPVVIIIAKDDEMLRPIDFSSLPKSVEILTIIGDHNFTGVARAGLIDILKTTLF